jgi:hypothetical protein
VFVDRKVTELIDNQYGGLQVTLELALETAGGLGRCQGVDNIHGGGEEHRVSIQGPTFGQSKIQVIYPNIQLTEVVDKGNRYPVPQTHRGLPINNPGPHNVGLLALMELEGMLNEAEQLVT